MGGFKIYLKKIIQLIRFSLFFYYNKSIDNAINLSAYKKNNIFKKIKFKFFGNFFTSPLSNQTLLAIKKMEESKKTIQQIYKKLDCPTEIFDIGANIGYWSYSFIKINGIKIKKIHCFEPFSISFKYLKLNLGDIENVILYNYGLSNADYEDKISLPEWEFKRSDNLGLYSVFSNSDINSEIIKLKKFDNIFYIRNQTNYLFKIDVEGMENKVIEGAFKFLSSKNKISVIIELNKKIDQYADNNIEKSIELLDRLKFKPFLFVNDSFHQIKYDDLKSKINNNQIYDFIFKNF